MNLTWHEGVAWPAFHDVERTLDGLRLHAARPGGRLPPLRRRPRAPVARLITGAAADLPTRPRLVKGVLDRPRQGRDDDAALEPDERGRRAAPVLHQRVVLAPVLAAGPVVWGVSPETPGTGLGALGLRCATCCRSAGRSAAAACCPPRCASRSRPPAARCHRGPGRRRSPAPATRVRGVRLADGSEVAGAASSCRRATRADVRRLAGTSAGRCRSADRRWRATEPEDGYESKIDAVVTALPRYRALADGLEERLGFDALQASMMIAPSTRRHAPRRRADAARAGDGAAGVLRQPADGRRPDDGARRPARVQPRDAVHARTRCRAAGPGRPSRSAGSTSTRRCSNRGSSTASSSGGR